MKAFAFAALALVLSLSCAAQAKDKTVGSLLCYVHANGHYTGEVVFGEKFFRDSVAFSNRHNTCVIAKIYGEEASTRVYVNGRRLVAPAGGLTTGDAKAVLRMSYINPNSCTVFSCEQSIL